MIKLSDIKQEWLKDPEISKYYQEMEPEFEIARQFIKARLKAKMTQGEVAKKMNTTQSVIARLESGKSVPTIKTIDRYAKAIGMRFKVRFV